LKKNTKDLKTNKIMKIGIDIRSLMDVQYSGVSEYTLNLVKEILKLDSKNKYILFYNSFKDITNIIPEFKQANAEIVYTKYPNKIFNYLMQKLFFYPKLDKLLGVDTFWAPHINFIRLSRRGRSILTIHDLSFVRYPEYFSFRKNIWHWAINVKRIIEKFDTIVAVSKNTKNDIMDLYNIPADKVKVIYSGIGQQYRVIDNNDKNLESVRKKYGLPEKFILFLGTLEPRKNIEGIIRSYNKFRENNSDLGDYRLVIAGGQGWRSGRIFKEYNKSKFKKDVKFLGYIAGEDKPYIYNLSSLFIYPSFYEGFGFPPLEAMACGLPVITSFSSSLTEIVGQAALTIDPYNINEIAAAIKELITDDNLKKILRAKGLERAGKFNWEYSARKYLNIFKEDI